MEDSYKILRIESEQKLAAGSAQVREGEDGDLEVDASTLKRSDDGSIKVRGTKLLMEGLHNENHEIQDVKAEEILIESRVDARKKAQEENANRVESMDIEEKYDLDDDLFN